MDKILVTGAGGLVGSRFCELSKYKDNLVCPTKEELDITDKKSVERYKDFDLVINFAAYTNVSEGEKQRGDKTGLCWKVNVEGVRNLLSITQNLIQISTDLVFAGVSGPYKESELAETDSDKVTWYGFTKAEAERLVREKGTIVR